MRIHTNEEENILNEYLERNQSIHSHMKQYKTKMILFWNWNTQKSLSIKDEFVQIKNISKEIQKQKQVQK